MIDNSLTDINSNLIDIKKILVNNGQILDESYDMNNITEGLYRQGGTSMPANSPDNAYNAYI